MEDFNKLYTELGEDIFKHFYTDNNLDGVKVYHYTNINALYEILEKKSLRLTNSEFLNDREEILYSIGIIEKIYETLDKKYMNINLLKRMIEQSLKYKFILSFSINKDSIALWGNYTNFEGYNIEMNMQEVFETASKRRYISIINSNEEAYYLENCLDSKSFGKVIYDVEKQKVILKELIEALNYSFNDDIELDSIARNVIRREALKTLIHFMNIFKHPGFEQEEEYRLVYTLNKKSYSKLVMFTNRNGVIVPYIQIALMDRFNKIGRIPIKSITIGPKSNMQMASKGLKRFLEIQKYKPIEMDENKHYSNGVKILKSEIPYR